MMARLEGLFLVAAAYSHCGLGGFDSTPAEVFLQNKEEVRSLYTQ
jgi:hypothetical protein